MNLMIAIILIFLVSLVMSVTGRGGGNFYVPILIALGLSTYNAAATAQLILTFSALAAMLVFHKSKMVDWKLALVLDPPTDIMAFVGGYYAHIFPENILKTIFAVLLVIAAFIMIVQPKNSIKYNRNRLGFWHREYGENSYTVNLWLAIPFTAAVGFIAGMVGISGGSFKVPLMVLVCGVPMQIAVGTSSAMVAATALMGFIGHAIGSNIDISNALILSSTGVVGGITGSRLARNMKPRNLKRIFAYTTLAAAIFMFLNIWLTSN